MDGVPQEPTNNPNVAETKDSGVANNDSVQSSTFPKFSSKLALNKKRKGAMADSVDDDTDDRADDDIILVEASKDETPAKRSKHSQSTGTNGAAAITGGHIGQDDGPSHAGPTDGGETSAASSSIVEQNGDTDKTEVVWGEIEKLRQRYPKADMNVCFYRLESAADPVVEAAQIEIELRDHMRSGSLMESDDDDGANKRLCEEQARHICENFPEASYQECYRRLRISNDINAEVQKIVDELNRDETLRADDDQQASVEVTALPAALPPLKRQRTDVLAAEKREKANPESGDAAEAALLPSIKPTDSLQGDILWIQVQMLRDRFPDKDPNPWYARLERADDILAETDNIIRELENGGVQWGVPAEEERGGGWMEEERALAVALLDGIDDINQPMKEVMALIERIRTMIPDVNFEICFRRLIRCENLELEGQKIVEEFTLPTQYADPLDERDDDDDRPGPSNRNARSSPGISDNLPQEHRAAVDQITQMFPDCDPYYVVKKIAENGMRIEALIDRMTSTSYPKLKDRLTKARQDRRRQEFLDPDRFHTEEFLRVFPDPEAYFANTQRAVSELYRYHAFAQLQNEFPHVEVNFLRTRLEEHNNHYLSAWRAVQADLLNSPAIGRGKKRGAKVKVPYLNEPRERVPFPDEVDEQFYRELQYAIYQERIKGYLENRSENRKRRVEEASGRNELAECPVCYSDDVLPEELVTCSNAQSPHQFCRTCVQRHAEELIGQGQHRITCLGDDCGQDMSLATLRRMLQPRLIDLILRRSQQEEIRTAGVENMETCPFCDFAVIMDVSVDNDRVFRCQNPDCLKESCRLCKEPNHVPLKCNEVEKADETAMRTFVENRMAEALIRTCPKCNKRIIKEDGCNKMVCPCGVFFCYVCRQVLQPTNPYDHFKEQPRSKKGASCALYTQLQEVHDEVAKKAGETAREEYLAKHPELRDDNKKTVDVKTLVDDSNKNPRRPDWARGGMIRLADGPFVQFRPFYAQENFDQRRFLLEQARVRQEAHFQPPPWVLVPPPRPPTAPAARPQAEVGALETARRLEVRARQMERMAVEQRFAGNERIVRRIEECARNLEERARLLRLRMADPEMAAREEQRQLDVAAMRRRDQARDAVLRYREEQETLLREHEARDRADDRRREAGVAAEIDEHRHSDDDDDDYERGALAVAEIARARRHARRPTPDGTNRRPGLFGHRAQRGDRADEHTSGPSQDDDDNDNDPDRPRRTGSWRVVFGRKEVVERRPAAAVEVTRSESDDDDVLEPARPVTRSQAARDKAAKDEDNPVEEMTNSEFYQRVEAIMKPAKGRSRALNQKAKAVSPDRESMVANFGSDVDSIDGRSERNVGSPSQRTPAAERGEPSGLQPRAAKEGEEGAGANAGPDANEKPTKEMIILLRKAVKEVNAELIKFQQRAIRQGRDNFGADVRDAMNARDVAYRRLVAMEARAMEDGIMKQAELDALDDGQGPLTAADIAESVEEAETRVEANRANNKKREATSQAAERCSAIERAMLSIQYFAQVTVNRMVTEDQLRDAIANVRETVLRPMNELEPGNAIMAHTGNVLGEVGRALANRATGPAVVPLQEYAYELRVAFQSVEGEMRRMLDNARGLRRTAAATAQPPAPAPVQRHVHFGPTAGAATAILFEGLPPPPPPRRTCIRQVARKSAAVPSNACPHHHFTRHPPPIQSYGAPLWPPPPPYGQMPYMIRPPPPPIARPFDWGLFGNNADARANFPASTPSTPWTTTTTTTTAFHDENAGLPKGNETAQPASLPGGPPARQRLSARLLQELTNAEAEEQRLMRQQRMIMERLDAVRVRNRRLRADYERTLAEERAEQTRQHQPAAAAASDLVKKTSEVEPQVLEFGTVSARPLTKQPTPDDTPEMATTRRQLIERILRLRERLVIQQNRLLQGFSQSASRRIREQIERIDQQLTRLSNLLDRQNSTNAQTSEARLQEIRGWVDHYEKVTINEIEAFETDEPEPTLEEIVQDSSASAAESEAAVVESDDSDVQVIRQSPGPTIEWESETVKESRQRQKDDEPEISVVPKSLYMKNVKKEEPAATASLILDDTDDGPSTSSAIPKRISNDKPPARSTDSIIDVELEEIMRQDDPVQILDVVSAIDQIGTSATASLNGMDETMRDVLLAMQASMTDFFGPQSGQHLYPTSTTLQQQPPESTAGSGLVTPQRQAIGSSPTNFVQINVNVQPAATFGLHLRQQPAPPQGCDQQGTAIQATTDPQQQQEQEGRKVEEERLMWW